MNTTINIHLSQVQFSIDTGAFDLLRSYLDELELILENTKDKQEILEDIESRIAEIFTEYSSHKSYVISVKEVHEMIGILGKPKDIVDEESIDTDYVPKEKTKIKNLYRDSEGILGGVAKGLSYYFGIDVVWIRLIFIALLFWGGGSVLIYIILWIITPKAVTTEDKLRMKRKAIDLSGINKKVKDEMEAVSNRMSNTFKKKKVNHTLSNLLSGIASVILFILKLGIKIFGFVLLFTGSILFTLFIIATVLLLVVGMAAFPIQTIPIDFVSFDFFYPNWVAMSISLLIFLSFIYILVSVGLKMISSRIKIPFGISILLVLLLWIAFSILMLLLFNNMSFETFAFTIGQMQMAWENFQVLGF